MYSDLSKPDLKDAIDYAISDSKLSFNAYINHCRDIIKARRTDLNTPQAAQIIDTNAPFELLPADNHHGSKIGALLIHGLLDSPFSLKDIGLRLQAKGIHCRAVLLPGHGTTPHDLLNISYQDWVQAVNYGVASFRNEVDKLFLIGYSTGAALSLTHALQDSTIAGVVLLSPAIRIKAPVSIVVGWQAIKNQIILQETPWFHHGEERDYAKYQSISFNAIKQVATLTKRFYKQKVPEKFQTPIFMVMSKEDETISSSRAIDFFRGLHHPDSQLLLYTGRITKNADPRIILRLARYPERHIKNLSHIAIPFAPDNPHYGNAGDYLKSSRPGSNNDWYGAYNRLEVDIYEVLHHIGILPYQCRELTFNPDFDYMTDNIYKFLSKINPR